MRFDVVRPEDDDALRRLLRENPMEGAIRVTLEREPDSALAATIEGYMHQTVAVRADGDGRLIGIGSRAVSNAFVNGEPTPLGYLGQLRIDRTQPTRSRLLRGGYAKLRELHGDGETDLYVTTIVADNRPARRLLEAGLDGFPRYQPLEELVTLVIPVVSRRRKDAASARVRRATRDDVEAIVDCLGRNGRRHQFARCWSEADLCSPERARGLALDDFFVLDRAGRVVGCVALWDQRAYKQTVVRGYAPWLARLRPLVNLVGPVIGQPRLPRPGQALAGAFASHFAADDDEPETALALLSHVTGVARARGIHYVSLGFARRHPLLSRVKRAFPHREYVSVIYRVYLEDEVERASELDGRVPHLELATL